MAFKDMREFVGFLEERGELVRPSVELESGYEVSSMMCELAERQGPAMLFKLKGFDIPVLMNTHGTLERNCMGLGLEPKETFRENFLAIRNRVAEMLEDKSQWHKPTVVTTAPCQEVVISGDDVDLYKLPVFKWSPLDGGPYITLTNVITKDPIAKGYNQNTGMYRVMIHNKNTTGVMCCATQDIGIHVARARAKGLKSIPLAIALGVDPVINICSTTKMGSFLDDEFEFAGGLRGEPVEMVKGKTVDLLVPATAEMIIEGQLDIEPENARIEGTF
ncbi:MAG: UbiD family decarboxylase, partial [Desulfotomaculaceae bacterium]|nr:UbiD family decarboxylase [Desulfotomaculaceae bacterium]